MQKLFYQFLAPHLISAESIIILNRDAVPNANGAIQKMMIYGNATLPVVLTFVFSASKSNIVELDWPAVNNSDQLALIIERKTLNTG